MAATADALVAWARDQIGTTEDPPGSNRVRYWDDCGQPGAQGQPWCCAFVLAGLLKIGSKPVTRSVYVPRIVSDYDKAGRLHPVRDAQPGDQVLFHFGEGHTGIVVSINHTARTVTAIEGNTSSNSSGSQDNGGGVYQRTRKWSLVTGVGRPLFVNPGVKPMFSPPLSIVAWKLLPQGLVAVGPDGGVFCEPGNIYRGGPNGKPYWAGMTPAQVDAPNAEERAAGKEYVIVNTAGQRYAYPE